MTWLKIDDAMWHNPKITALSARAFRAHVLAMCSCAEFSTDGYVSGKTAKQVGAKGPVLVELVSVLVPNRSPLWVEDVDGGFLIHDYLEYNPSRADLEAGKRMRRSRAKRAASARWDAHSNAQSMAPSSDTSMPRPDNPLSLTDQEDFDDVVVVELLHAIHEHERSQAHLELLSLKARGASEHDFREVLRSVSRKHAANPRAYACKALENRLRERAH